MATKKPTDKNTKAEILQAYEELVKEQAALKTQLEQKPTEKPPATKEQPKPESKPEPKIAMTQPTTIQQKMNNPTKIIKKNKIIL